jgi:hypothetical protein
VWPAHQTDVVPIRAAAETERIPMVVLESVPLRTSPSLRVHEAALASVAAIDETASLGGKIP